MNQRILVVDDETMMLEIVRRTLESLGYQVSTAHHGGYGLELFEAIGHDLVLTDLSMPVMNGLRLIEEVKKISPQTPTILFTTETAELANTVTPFVNRLLKKPATREDIVNAVRSLLPEQPA